MPSQIGCQMYTLRDYTKTPADLAQTLRKVKKIGYDAVQTSAQVAGGLAIPAWLSREIR